jgi:hypothetical protein
MCVRHPHLICKLIETDEPLELSDFDAKEVYGPNYVVKYLEFPVGTGPYGQGGWSRGAHRPKPTVVSLQTDDVVFKGKSVFVNGVRRLKANVWSSNGEVLRRDYPDLILTSDDLQNRRR